MDWIHAPYINLYIKYKKYINIHLPFTSVIQLLSFTEQSLVVLALP